MSAQIHINADFDLAVNYVCYTHKSVFLTGKAGTGKTTFLKYISNHLTKKMAIAAPTGVAAVNAGGSTLHSLFQLPFGTYIPNYPMGWSGQQEINNKNTLLAKLRMSNAKRQLLEELELLVIDEVSMLRCDVLEAIDAILRMVRKKEQEPFGGLQLLFIGDLFQLPPVVNREEWQLMNSYYDSPFFFDAPVFKSLDLIHIELKTNYRQQDATFIKLLNQIRNNQLQKEEQYILDDCYQPHFEPDTDETYILLTSHNAKADQVNRAALEQLDAPVHYFDATIKGDFSDKNYPLDPRMPLKVGAQVMFVKNDKGEHRRYYNGKIGVVTKIQNQAVFVTIDQQLEIELEPEIWRNVNFKYNAERDIVEEEELGSFSQYPIRLAWAITIHKSQGLTFDKAIIDAGASFAPGQVYVALSRLTNLKGLVLRTKISSHNILTEPKVIAFTAQAAQQQHTQLQELKSAQREYIIGRFIEYFNLEKIQAKVIELYQSLTRTNMPDKIQAMQCIYEVQQKLQELIKVALQFTSKMLPIIQSDTKENLNIVVKRSQDAEQYFNLQLKQIDDTLKAHWAMMRLKPKTKKYGDQLRALFLLFNRKREDITLAPKLAEGLNNETNWLNFFDNKKLKDSKNSELTDQEDATVPPKAQKGNSKAYSLQLYQEGHSLQEIASLRSMAQSTIEGHLISYVKSGEVEITFFISQQDLDLVLQNIKNIVSDNSLSSLKERLPAEISYGQLRAVMAYKERMENWA